MSDPNIPPRHTLEEEKRRDMIVRTLRNSGVSDFEPEVVTTLSRWLIQESSTISQDKRPELLARGVSEESIPALLMTLVGRSL
jgi:hypothetical protein